MGGFDKAIVVEDAEAGDAACFPEHLTIAWVAARGIGFEPNFQCNGLCVNSHILKCNAITSGVPGCAAREVISGADSSESAARVCHERYTGIDTEIPEA